LHFIVHKKPTTTKVKKEEKVAYFEGGGNFKAKLGSNSYKKSGKIGLELNS